MKLKLVVLVIAYILATAVSSMAEGVVFSAEARKEMAKMGNEGYISIQKIGSG